MTFAKKFQRKSWSNPTGIVAAIAAFALTCSGCGPGGEELGQVTGTVTQNGQPVEGGMLEFTPSGGGRVSVATTDAEGKYVLMYTKDRNGAELGKHTVSIQMGMMPADPPEEMQMDPSALMQKPAQGGELTPKEVEVTSGENVIDFTME